MKSLIMSNKNFRIRANIKVWVMSSQHTHTHTYNSVKCIKLLHCASLPACKPVGPRPRATSCNRMQLQIFHANVYKVTSTLAYEYGLYTALLAHRHNGTPLILLLLLFLLLHGPIKGFLTVVFNADLWTFIWIQNVDIYLPYISHTHTYIHIQLFLFSLLCTVPHFICCRCAWVHK